MTFPRGALAALLAAVALAALPAAAAAHSELASSSPARGETLAGGPAVITGEFTAPVDPARSSMELRGPDGATIARGGVPEGGPPTRMTIAGIGPLTPGRYTVRWTTVTADDDGVERGTFRFTVEAATPAPVSPAPTPTSATTPGATPSSAPTPGATPEPPPTEAPVPTGDPDQMPTAPGAADVLIPLVVLAVVLAGGVGMGRPAPPVSAALGTRSRRRVRLVAGVLAAVLVVGACGDAGEAAAGIVIALESSGGRVSGFTLRTPEGETIPFEVGELEVDGTAFAASHLTEHAVTLQPIAVAYRVVDGRNVVHRMVDAPWAGASP